MLTMRHVTKATELKRFKEIGGEHHYMGETHSSGDHLIQVKGSHQGRILERLVYKPYTRFSNPSP